MNDNQSIRVEAPHPPSRKVLISFTIYYPRQKFILVALALTVAAALLFSRNPSRFLHPQLWAEDGTDWLEQAYTNGFSSYLWPQAGYLQIFSRLAATSALFLPFSAIPLYFVLLSFCVQLLPAILLLSDRAATLIPSTFLRLAVIAYYIGEPNSFEVYVNLTNAMWHLALSALLVILLPKPVSKFVGWVDLLILVLSGISGPLVTCILPIAWWQTIRHRNDNELKLCLIYAATVSFCTIVQVCCLLTHHSQRLGNLGANYTRFVHIIADQLILAGSIGAGNVNWLCRQTFWQSALLPSVTCLAGIGIVALAFKYGSTAYRQFFVFAFFLMAAALIAPIVSFSAQWQAMQYPGGGDRYYVIPMLAWFLSCLVVVNKLSRGQRPFYLILSVFLIGIVTDWRYSDLPATSYQTAAANFIAAPPGATITFPEDPPPWHFALTKK